MPTRSAKRMLLELAYDGDLRTDVREMLADDRSWRWIAAKVTQRTGHEVSHETLRRWYGTTAKSTEAVSA